MAHGHGEAKMCSQRWLFGQDMPTRNLITGEQSNRGAHNAHVLDFIRHCIELRRQGGKALS